jgi:hypothetical protein
MVFGGDISGMPVARGSLAEEASAMDIIDARNLACHRATQSVWDKRGWSGVTIEERLGPWLVSLVGTALLIAGARRRSLRGAHLMLGGAGLIGCAAAGLCNPRHATVRWRHLTGPRTDGMTSGMMDSFPASDPPSSNLIGTVAV